MSWQIDTITLPVVSRVIDRWESTYKTQDIPANLPYYVVIGKRRILELEGYIFEPGKTKDYLETTYVIPLRNKVRSIVTVSAPDTRYDGNYILNSVSFEESGRFGISFNFKIQLLGYSTAIVL